MALNLSPRSYHVDWTGKDATLDPDPLLRAQERNFASQKETMQMVYETGRKGVEFAEYLGARQQLGRVKAQLADLDPNDPEFARRYSAIVSDNPLAFMNPNTAPVAKMALAPLAAASLQAQQQRDAMARITETYQGRERAWAARPLRGFAPPQPRVPTLTEGWLPGNELTATPAPAPGTSTDTYDPERTPEPRPGVPDQGSLVYPLPGEGANGSESSSPLPPFSPDGQAYDPTETPVDGEGDGQGVLTAPPGIFKTPVGQAYMDRSTGNSPSIKFVAPPAAMPVDPPDEGNRWSIKATNQLGQATEWEQKPLANRTKEERDALDKRILGHLSVNPQLMASAAKLAGAKETAEQLKRHYDALKATDDPEKAQGLKDIVAPLAQAGKELSEAMTAHGALDATLRDEWTMRLDPEYAKETNEMRAIEAQAEAERVASLQGAPRNLRNPDADITATPAPPPQAAPKGTASEQLDYQKRGPEIDAKNKAWTEEKTFAVSEARSLSAQLGLTENAIIKAVQDKDAKSLNAILRVAQERGVVSPLFFKDPMAPTLVWAKPKLKGARSYLDVLRAAATDPGVTQASNSGEGWKWTAKPTK